MTLWTPAHRSITLPGRPRRRVPMRPDGRHLLSSRLSGAPLHPDEIDYDELAIDRSWRSWDDDEAGAVRYFMYQLSQRNPGDAQPITYFKAIRFLRLTRVPRWLRQQGSGVGRAGYTQMAYILSALREQGVLFCQMVAKTPDMPLVYAYGVQAVAATVEDAQQGADEAYASLSALLDGTFQQIEYAPIKLEEAEALMRHQATWNEIAVARGRPMTTTESIGAAAILDGNRTDIEQTHNQMEAFIRGMSETRKGFMLSIVTTPLLPEDMTLAWRNIAEKLSLIKSEVYGTRAFTAGVALPLSVGSAGGQSYGDTHSQTASQGVSSTEGASVSDAASTSFATSNTDSATVAQGVSVTETTAETATSGLTVGQSLSDTVTQGISNTQSSVSSVGETMSTAQGMTLSDTIGQGFSLSESLGLGSSITDTTSSSVGVSQGETTASSLAVSTSEGVTTSDSFSSAVGQSQTVTDGQSVSSGSTASESVGGSWSVGDSTSAASSQQSGTNASGGILGFGGGANSTSGNTNTQGSSSSVGTTSSVSNGSTLTNGQTFTNAAGVSSTQTAGSTSGQSYAESLAATNSMGQSASTSASQGLSNATGTSRSVGMGTGHSLSTSSALAESLQTGRGFANTLANGTSTGESFAAARATGSSMGVSEATATSVGRAAGASDTTSVGTSTGTTSSVGQTASQAASTAFGTNRTLADAYAVAMSRQASSTGSLGVVPNFGVSIAKQTVDASKQMLSDVLEATMKRYFDGVEGGAFLYQMFLLAEDRETMMAAAALLKSAFWGPGTADARTSQPFHLITDFSQTSADPDAEKQRLVTHARAFTSYRRREPVIEIIEPFRYSSYATVGELSAFSRPPVAEGIGLLTVHDSAPVLAMPADRQHRDVTIGKVFNGERARTSNVSWGMDADELTHVLVAGQTGSGKTTTLMRMLTELCQVERTVVHHSPDLTAPPETVTVPASVLALDWMKNMRHLGTVVDPVRVDPVTGEKVGRFQLFSVRNPELGRFTWNPLAIPDTGIHPGEWLNAAADNMVASWNLGEVGRSLIVDFLERLYRANRLHDTVLRPETVDDLGNVVRPAIVLDAIPRDELPDDAIWVDDTTGEEIACVYTYAPLSRLVGIPHLAVLVAAEWEKVSTVEGGRQGTSVRDRLQSLWRRVSYFSPGATLSDMITFDTRLSDPSCLTLADIVDADRGLVTVIETDGLDMANRRFVLGSMLLAVYHGGLHRGEGCYNQNGQGVGLFVVLEEAHELFGSRGEDDDTFSATTRTALYESMHRRIRALGARLIDVVQNPGDIPEAVTSNTATVLIHRVLARADRERVFNLLNWSNTIGQQLREWRWLGEMPRGYLIARLDARHNYLESAPVQVVCEPAALGVMDDSELRRLAHARQRRLSR